jgi:hypothetical protein
MNLLLVAFVAVASPALVELEEQGRTHLYNLDYASARSIFGELSARAPSSPVGPYYQATTLWMEEFTRRGGMAGSTFRTGSYWDEKNRAPVEESLDRDFKALAAEAIARADAILELNPRDRDALYFRGASEGVLSAYHASLEHSYYRS